MSDLISSQGSSRKGDYTVRVYVTRRAVHHCKQFIEKRFLIDLTIVWFIFILAQRFRSLFFCPWNNQPMKELQVTRTRMSTVSCNKSLISAGVFYLGPDSPIDQPIGKFSNPYWNCPWSVLCKSNELIHFAELVSTLSLLNYTDCLLSFFMELSALFTYEITRYVLALTTSFFF